MHKCITLTKQELRHDIENQGNKQLSIDRILCGSIELFNVGMLLDPAKKNFYFPPLLIDFRNGLW